jgi:RimJ/RimL family protein N-acetyltransferase
MLPRRYELEDGSILHIRQAAVDDARALLDYVHAISGESDFLTFGPGEFELTVPREEAFIRSCLASYNQIYLVGLVEDEMVAALIFSGGRRRRVRHSGELSMSVRKAFWGLGIGSRMLDALITWARDTRIVKKINLRVRADHHRAIRLYERKGFVREGTLRKGICLDDTFYDQHWMGLEL